MNENLKQIHDKFEENNETFRRQNDSTNESLRQLKEDNKQNNEKIDGMKKEITENSKKQTETLKENVIRQLNEKLDSTNKKLESKIDGIKAVSYTHLDVYKRQYCNKDVIIIKKGTLIKAVIFIHCKFVCVRFFLFRSQFM